MTRSRILTVSAFLVCAYMFLAGLGGPALTLSDEGRNAEVAREMSESGNWLIPTHNGIVYLDKPAFYFKLVGLSLSALGVNEFAARLPSALMGLALLAMMWFVVRREAGDRCAALAVVIVGTTPLYFAFARLVIMDMTLAFFVCGAIFAGYIAESMEGVFRKRWYLLGAALSGAATFVKGPVGFVVPTLVLLIFYRVAGHRGAWKRHLAPWNIIVFFAVVLPWFLGVLRYRPDFAYYGLIEETIHRYTTDDFGRAEPIWFFPATLAGGLFAWSILLPESIVAAWRTHKQWTRLDKLCIVWSVALLVFFSLSHSKRPGYVLTLAVSLGILTARVCNLAIANKSSRAARIVRRGTIALAVIAGAVGVLLMLGLGRPHELTRVLTLREGMLESIRGSLIAACAVLGIVALVAVVAHWRRDARIAVAVFVLLPVLFGSAMFGIFKAVVETRSSRQLASQVQALEPGTKVACLKSFPNGLPFYLRQTVTIITSEGNEMESNYALFMIHKLKQWPAQFVAVDDLERWLDSQTVPVYLLARKGRRDQLRDLAAERGTSVESLELGYDGALFPPRKP